ncbi:MAG: c-type cytochrome biogenesis protein CcmI [Pseudomonadota bacterium]
MTAFAIGVVGLVVLAGVLLRPAWRRPVPDGGARSAHLDVLREQLAALDREPVGAVGDEQQQREARRELQRRVLDESAAPETAVDASRSPRTLWAVTLAVPLFAIALYAVIGRPAGLDVQPAAARLAGPAGTPEPEVAPEAVQAMLASLAQRLETPSADPASDLQGWTMLARSYAGLQRFADAERAYGRAIALAPRDAQLLADRADVLAVLQGQRTAGEPERLIAEALRLDPNNLKALALAGSAAYERRDLAGAQAYWQQARARAPADGAFAAGLDRSLAAVAQETGAGAAAPASPAVATATTAATTPTARLTGRVSLAPELAAQVAPTDTVFVFARAAEGPRMPLAVQRITVADLPFEFTLDDSLAMSPQARLSGASRVIVGARISRSGSATPQAGDLQGETGPVGTTGDGLRLSIDTARR